MNWAQALASTRTELYQALLALLIRARKDAGMTQVALADRVGRRQTFVSKYELGERRLDIAEFIIISRAIGADPLALIQNAETEGPESGSASP